MVRNHAPLCGSHAHCMVQMGGFGNKLRPVRRWPRPLHLNGRRGCGFDVTSRRIEWLHATAMEGRGFVAWPRPRVR